MRIDRADRQSKCLVGGRGFVCAEGSCMLLKRFPH
jgi:hypothetical protein